MAFNGLDEVALNELRDGFAGDVILSGGAPATPGPGPQVHDFNGGIPASGLFWTVQLPDDALEVSEDGRKAVLRAQDVPVIDSFQILGPNTVPASMSFEVTWVANGESQARGSGRAVGATDPTAFSGRFSPAKATGTFSGTESGFTFTSKPGASADDTFAEIGTERNGTFLSS